MRVALITEGAYPYRAGAASAWCHQLVCGQPRHPYHLIALTGAPTTQPPAYPLPANVDTVTTVPVWGRPAASPGRMARVRIRRAATNAAVLLCRGLVGDETHHHTMFADGLGRLAQLASDGTDPLQDTPLADVLMDAWRAALSNPTSNQPRQDPDPHQVGGRDFRVPLPRLSLQDAESAAVLLTHALRPLSVTVADADLCHAASGGLPLLVALATRWRAGTPYLLTEHGIYLRERYLDYGQELPEAVKAVMLRFFRALSRLGYAEAALVVAASRFNQRWQLRHGAHPARVLVVPGGVEPADFPHLTDQPADPTVVWAGRIEPGHDLHTLIRALREIRPDNPRARLRLHAITGGNDSDDDSTASYLASCQTLVQHLELSDAVTIAHHPPAPHHPAGAYATGQVVALPQLTEGTSDQLMGAMMCGRATVSTDVGGNAEIVGDAGVLVPPGDPVALGEAVRALLADPVRRRSLGAAARRRAYAMFRSDHLVRAYDHLYVDAASRNTDPTGTAAPASAISKASPAVNPVGKASPSATGVRS